MATVTKPRSSAYLNNLEPVSNQFIVNALYGVQAPDVYSHTTIHGKKINKNLASMFIGKRAEDEHHVVHELFVEGVNKGGASSPIVRGFPDLLVMNKVDGKYELLRYREGDTAKWGYLYGMF